MTLPNSSDSKSAAPAEREQRRVPRYEFVATIEFKDAVSATRLTGRVAEISRQGCYVDVLNSFPVGTLMSLQISRDGAVFACEGRIIYVQERLGMGVAFLDPPDDQLKILDAWLTELSPM